MDRLRIDPPSNTSRTPAFGFHAIPADGHIAPDPRSVLGVVVVGPAAALFATRFEAPPVAAPDRIVHDRQQSGDRPLGALAGGFERGRTRHVDTHSITR